jgi:hypothetical protein
MDSVILIHFTHFCEKKFENAFILHFYSNFEEVDGVVVHSLGFSAEGSGFESRPGPSESMKLFSTNKLITSTQNSTNVDSLELHL